jgi:hypothetical protein
VLTEVATQGNAAHPRILAREVFDDVPRFVWAAVLDQHDLETCNQGLQAGNQPAMQFVQEGRAPVNRHDD